MKILHLNLQGGGVGSYRHWTPAASLERKGHKVWYQPGSGFSLDAIGPDKEQFFMDQLDDTDIIHVGFTTHLPMVKLLATARNYALKMLGRSIPIITDIDDNIFDVPVYNPSFNAYTGAAEARRVALMGLRLSDAVTVTTQPLVEAYDDFNHHIYRLPNCINPQDWQWPVDPRRKDSKDVRIIFAGGKGRINDLNEIRPALESVMRQRPNVRLFFMGIGMPDWVQEQWCRSEEDASKNRAFWLDACDINVYRQIMQYLGFDICLAPVVKNDFNAGKSNIKVLESGMYGAASVCTDWHTYQDVPRDCTLKADTTYEWIESLLALIDDPVLRLKKANLSKQWALDMLSIDGNIHLWEEVYQDCLSRPVIDDTGQGIKDNLVRLATPQEASSLCQSSPLLSPRPDHGSLVV